MTDSVTGRIRSYDSFQLVLAASVVVLATNAHRHVPLLVIGAAFLAAVFLRPTRLRSPWWWLGISAACFAVDSTRFLELDDHIVLTHYWALGIGLSLLARDPEASLERNGQLLIGLTMLFAVGSKLAWGEFVDGGFFEATLLADERFVWVAEAAGVARPEANYDSFAELARTGRPVALETGPRVAAFSAALTVGTFVIEGGLALTHLVPQRGQWLLRLRTWLLAAFCVATYAVVPVAGFGSILLVMASADRRLDRPARTRRIAAAAALYGWGLVWTALH